MSKLIRELFDRYQTRVYNFILRTVGEDMLAEVVLVGFASCAVRGRYGPTWRNGRS